MSARGKVCVDCQRARARTSARRNHVERTYGLSPEAHAALLERQGGRCAICRGVRPYQLQVDHDHATGLVRGLLCKVCNRRLLPAAGDDPKRLAAAILYLIFPPAQTEAVT